MKNYQELNQKYPSISLRKFCETTGLCYQYLLKVSKQPIANQPYDPSSINYEAIQRIIDNRKTPLDLDSYNWEEIQAQAQVQSRNSGSNAAKKEDFTGAPNVTFNLRNKPETYFVIYHNEDNIVFGDKASTSIRVMNWNTFLHQGPTITEPTNTNPTEAENVAPSADTLASNPGSQPKAKAKRSKKK